MRMLVFVRERLVLLSAIVAWLAPGMSLAGSEGPVNHIRWKTASEVNNFGYHVYRSKEESGPFHRITSKPVGGAGTSSVPQDYEFADDTIEPCVAYWYYIESISYSGERAKFTPVRRSSPKPGPSSQSCE